MNFFIAGIVSISLASVSVLHFLWAWGSTFPAHDQRSLAMTVAGFRGVTKMPPPLASLVVAIGLLGCAMVPLLLLFQQSSIGLPLKLIGFAIGSGFVFRGSLGFTPWWRRRTPEQPFATLDRKYYSPFCLLVGTGLIVLSAGVLS